MMPKIKNKTELFASLMDICHLKNSEVKTKYQIIKKQIPNYTPSDTVKILHTLKLYLRSKIHLRHTLVQYGRPSRYFFQIGNVDL